MRRPPPVSATAEPRVPAQATLDRQIARWLFVVAACAFLLIAQGRPKLSDEISMLELSRSMLYERSLEVPDLPFVGVEGRSGQVVSKYGVGQPVLTMPFDLAGAAMSAPLDQPAALRDAIATSVVPLASALLVAWSYLLGRRLEARPADAAGVAVCAVLGSLVLVYATEYFAEPLVALLVVIAAERASVERWTSAFGALAIATVVHPRMAPLVLVLGLVAVMRTGLRSALGSAWPVALAGTVLLAYNYGRFGSLLESGYGGEGFNTPLVRGLVGLWFVGSKSVLLFAPLAVAGALAVPRLLRRRSAPGFIIGGFSLTVLLTTATWHSWQGGWSWGPRLLVPAVPLLTVALAPWLSEDRRRWGAAIVLSLVGFGASLPAVLAPSTAQLGSQEVGPSVLRQYELIPEVWRGTEPRGDGPFSELADVSPTFWQVAVTRSVGPPGDIVVVIASLTLIGGAVGAGRRVVKAISISESVA